MGVFKKSNRLKIITMKKIPAHIAVLVTCIIASFLLIVCNKRDVTVESIASKELPTLKSSDERTSNILRLKSDGNGLQARPQGGWYYTGTQTPGNLFHYGAATTFATPAWAKNSILQAAWVAVDFNLVDGRRMWAQWGHCYSADFGSNMIVHNFFYLNGGGEFFPVMRFMVNGIAAVEKGKVYKWSIEKNFNKEGVWNFCRNGIVIWEVDLPGTTHIIRAEIFCESQDTRIPRNFPLINFKPALELMDVEGNFTPIAHANTSQCNHGIKSTEFCDLWIGKGLVCGQGILW